MTMQVITQMEVQFRAWGYGVTLSKPTINRYIWLGMVGTFPSARGYEGTMPPHAFKLLRLVVESFIQINNVNSIVVEWLQLIMAVNTCCGVPPLECMTRHSVYDQVMRLTNVSLNADVSPGVEERLRWKTYPNLPRWFKFFQKFLIKFGFAEVNSNGDLTFMEEQKHRILNVKEMKISLDLSKTRAGGRPAVLFHDPHLPIASRSVSKFLLACTGIFRSSAAGKCKPAHFQLPTSATAEEREKIQYEFLIHHFGHTPQNWLHREEKLAMHNRDKQKGRNDR